MNLRWAPTRTAARAGLRYRTLQTLVIAFVILLASGAATLALSLVVETDAPFDHAFAAANGAHLVIEFDARRVSESRLKATASAAHVTAAVGPWAQVETPISTGNAGARAIITGRPGPDTAVDRLTMESGQWAQAPGEIVLSQSMADSLSVGIGAQVNVGAGASPRSFLVVGIAASVGRVTDAWVIPSEIASLATPGSPLEYQMLYRVRPAGTSNDLRRATQAIAAELPAGSVLNVSNYLDVKRNADLTTEVMVPFLLAFSAFALLAAIFIIGNVVSGVVIAAYRDFGVMKSIGFTPAQVMLVLLAEILVPVTAGCLAGIPVGTLAAQPFLQQTAHALGLPAPFTAALPVVLLVLGVVLAATLLAALVPAWRAGRMSAVAAITTGTAPSAGRSGRLSTAVAALPLPRAITLGIGDPFARPVRSATTLGAILIGVATVVFGLSLHLSLQQVAVHLIRDQYVQVDINRPTGQLADITKPGAPSPGSMVVPSDRQTTIAIRTNPGTARFVAEAQGQVTVPGIAEPVPYYAYRGTSDWIGYALISGRWFSRPGEVVAPTKVLTQANLHVGQYFTARIEGALVRLHLVGEILDQDNGDLLLRGTWATLAAVTPHLQATDYEVQLKSGTTTQGYFRSFSSLSQGGPLGLDFQTVERSSANTTFILFNGVIAGLALILLAIAVAGVFNTVVLATREKVRELAILKAIGMAPAQVVAMVIAAVAFLGLIAGASGIPVGYILHRQIIQFMGQIAGNTAIPPAFFDLIDHRFLPLLALAGVVIAAIGAWLPAQWAAARRVAGVLQSE